jgi:hypothetical protein
MNVPKGALQTETDNDFYFHYAEFYYQCLSIYIYIQRLNFIACQIPVATQSPNRFAFRAFPCLGANTDLNSLLLLVESFGSQNCEAEKVSSTNRLIVQTSIADTTHAKTPRYQYLQ